MSSALPEHWGDLAPLLDRLLDADPPARAALLADLTRDDPARRADLERLLAEAERADSLFDRPAVEQFPSLLEEDPGPPLPELLGGCYRIERELGSGGMARVYLARDERHTRPVAVKVIRHEIASTLGRNRFLREIGIAARLRHPNIMPLYDSGDADGLLYFVMPFEEGNSLRARLTAGPPLTIPEAISILRDVARALACAHEQGVVHRDIKPDNVLLSGGAAVVTDFGIAKALTDAATTSGSGPATLAGTVIGTPAYMSPEQAMGDPAADHRTDIYAFGCLAYEVFAGTPPFVGDTAWQVVSAQLSEQPRPLGERRSETPEPIAHLVGRCLQKDPDARPASAAELLETLATMPAVAGRVAAPAPRHPRRRLVVALLGFLLLALAGFYAAWATRGGPVTIAVLPLEVQGDSLQDVAVGFGDDLASELSKVRWLLVKSRIGALKYRARDALDPGAIGDSLGVRYVLTSSFRREGGGTAAMLTLTRSEDGVIFWTEKFSNPEHLAQLRDQVVRAVGDTLRREAGRFAGSGPIEIAREYPIGDDAYTVYLRGRERLATRGPGIAQSILLFREAIRLDSSSAKAWAGLSLALTISAVNQNVHIDSVRSEATASAARALRLDSTLALPHIALGVIHAIDWQWDTAQADLKRAMAKGPHEVEARIHYIRVLNAMGRVQEAMRQIDAALEIDPASSLVLGFKSHNYLLQGKLDSAHMWSDRARLTDSTNFVAGLLRSLLLVKLGRLPEARQLVLRSAPFEPISLYTLAATGDTATVRARLALLAGPKSNHPAVGTARAYAFLGLGDTAAALDALELATDRREIWPTISSPGMPMFDAIRETPRFRALYLRMHLPQP